MGMYRATMNLPGHPFGKAIPLDDDDPTVIRRTAAGTLERLDVVDPEIVEQVVDVPVMADPPPEVEPEPEPEVEAAEPEPEPAPEAKPSPAARRRAAAKAREAAEQAEPEPAPDNEPSDPEVAAEG